MLATCGGAAYHPHGVKPSHVRPTEQVQLEEPGLAPCHTFLDLILLLARPFSKLGRVSLSATNKPRALFEILKIQTKALRDPASGTQVHSWGLRGEGSGAGEY